MQREISYEWSPDLVRLGTRRFIFRYAGSWVIAFSLIIIFAVMAATGQATSFFWIAIILLIYASAWFAYYRRALRICREMPDRKITVRIEPETITFQTSEHVTTMKWSRIRKLWSYPDVLLLFTYDSQTYLMLPVAPLGEDGKRFIEEKVREHGGQVA